VIKALHRISIILVAIPLVATGASSLQMIAFIQREQLVYAGTSLGFSYQGLVHEAGFGRLALAVIGLLILLIPYRRAERWAFAAIGVLMICYELPVFFLFSVPNIGSWSIFRYVPEIRTSSFETINFYRYLFTILALAGLAMAAPLFIRKHGHSATGGA
jgi:hypothetical protein